MGTLFVTHSRQALGGFQRRSWKCWALQRGLAEAAEGSLQAVNPFHPRLLLISKDSHRKAICNACKFFKNK